MYWIDIYSKKKKKEKRIEFVHSRWYKCNRKWRRNWLLLWKRKVRRGNWKYPFYFYFEKKETVWIIRLLDKALTILFWNVHATSSPVNINFDRIISFCYVCTYIPYRLNQLKCSAAIYHSSEFMKKEILCSQNDKILAVFSAILIPIIKLYMQKDSSSIIVRKLTQHNNENSRLPFH